MIVLRACQRAARPRSIVPSGRVLFTSPSAAHFAQAPPSAPRRNFHAPVDAAVPGATAAYSSSRSEDKATSSSSSSSPILPTAGTTTPPLPRRTSATASAAQPVPPASSRAAAGDSSAGSSGASSVASSSSSQQPPPAEPGLHQGASSCSSTSSTPSTSTSTAQNHAAVPNSSTATAAAASSAPSSAQPSSASTSKDDAKSSSGAASSSSPEHSKYDLYYLLSKASGCVVSAVLFYFLYQEDFSIKKAEIRFLRWFRTLPLYPPPKATVAVRNSTVGSDVLEKFGSAETLEALQEWFLLKDAKLEKGVTRDEVLIFLEEGAQITKDTDLVCRQFLRQQGDGDRSNEKCRLLGVALEEFLRFVADVLETNFRLADDDQKEQEAALRRAAGKGVREMTLSGAGGLGMGAVLGRGAGAAGPGSASAAFVEDDVSIAHTLQFEKARLEEMIESMEAKGASLNVSQRRQLESARHELGKVNEDLAMNK